MNSTPIYREETFIFHTFLLLFLQI